MEDLTVKSQLADSVKELKSVSKSMVGRELKMIELKKEIADLKEQVKNCDGKNGNDNQIG